MCLWLSSVCYELKTLIILVFSKSKLHPVYKFLYGDDVWVMGVHTLVHGDARPPVHVLGLELRQGGSPVLVIRLEEGERR